MRNNVITISDHGSSFKFHTAQNYTYTITVKS